MSDRDQPPPRVPLRLLAAVGALAGGATAVIVAIDLVRGVLG
jgi:hypothetical protein